MASIIRALSVHQRQESRQLVFHLEDTLCPRNIYQATTRKYEHMLKYKTFFLVESLRKIM